MTVGTDERAGVRRWAALAALTLAVTLLAVDGTVLALAVPALMADLEPTGTQLLWIGDVYSFALAGLLISMGTLADRIGRRRLLLFGVAGFGAASLLAAFAPGAGWLIAARVLLGVAGATLMPSTLSLVRNLFPEPGLRTRAIAVWAAGASGGAALGPLVGGVLLEHFWWGSVFVINLPIMLLVLLGVALLVPESRNPAPGPFDPLSALLSVTAVVPIVWAVKHVAHEGADLPALIAALAGLACAIWFVRRQRALPSPLVDVTLFTRPAFSGTILASMIAIFAFSGLLFFFSQYLQLVRGYSPLQAGLRELPLTLASIAVVAVAVRVMARLGVGRALGASLLAAAAGLAVLAVGEGLSGFAVMAVGLVVVGLGVGLAFTAATDAVLAAVPAERAGAASAISEMAYELGVALGIALLGTVQAVLYRDALPDLSGWPVGSRAAVDESLATAVQSGPAVLVPAAQEAFSSAMQTTSYVAAVLLLVAGLLAWRLVPSERVAS
ncbi:MFS transporter [Paractinoplanes abujensis]|uniref:DHA2 family multidrug resistance protein-like MFS transporter n=1 Tax=Paractinoplanes abujensis TaxID=882441 RepID=A0A7W7CSA4_9ACTN|nr:MFS transporter [Actinoplanes abujensis]MBB4693748.1 DHA2 family multidrug resistance protein-like MFS transporter [Actinoplanes abujensis]GID21595.1 MFS transporter [Actinoplanes abujensis]